jgi:hypothetical protein
LVFGGADLVLPLRVFVRPLLTTRPSERGPAPVRSARERVCERAPPPRVCMTGGESVCADRGPPRVFVRG